MLRRMQYRVADDPSQSCRVAGMMIFGKVYNAKWSVERTRRDHAMRIDESRFSAVSDQLQGLLPQIAAETSTVCAASRVSVRRHISACWTT